MFIILVLAIAAFVIVFFCYKKYKVEKEKMERADLEQRLQKRKEVEEKAEKGDPQAQYEMALYTRSDLDFGIALAWLEKASQQGHQDAQNLKTQIENEEIYFYVYKIPRLLSVRFVFSIIL